jgi:competence protein ComGC
MENNDKKKRSFWEIAMYVYIIGVIVTVLIAPVPHLKKSDHGSAKVKACYSNIRVIQGAVEMYNMDVKNEEDLILTLNDSETQNPTILKGYLKPVRHYEPMCRYKSKDLDKENGGIYCEYHGDIDGSLGIKGLYQKPSILSTISMSNFINECQYQFPYALVWPILWPFIFYMNFSSR